MGLPIFAASHPGTVEEPYSHHDLEVKDAADFHFGEAWRLK
jgi:hypothetical protein